MREIGKSHSSREKVENPRIKDSWRVKQERTLTEEERDTIIRQFNAEYPIIKRSDGFERERTTNAIEDNHDEGWLANRNHG